MEKAERERVWSVLGKEDDEFTFGYVEYEHVWDVQDFSHKYLDVWA